MSRGCLGSFSVTTHLCKYLCHEPKSRLASSSKSPKKKAARPHFIAAFFAHPGWGTPMQDIQPRTLIAIVYRASQSGFLILLNWCIGRAFYSLDVILASLPPVYSLILVPANALRQHNPHSSGIAYLAVCFDCHHARAGCQIIR